jgi:3-hydroxyacyl-CoA dehydrogenase/enoyl-CoA hydratase/3-hydroxybutyryl-CoA epimerase
VRLILNSSQLTATQAKHIGLVDAALRPLSFEQDVERFIQDRLAENALQPGSRGWLARWRDGTSIGQRMALWFANRKIAARALHYPALAAALRAIEAGITGGMEVGLAREREEFCRVLFDPNCRSLLQLFLWRERARKPSTWLNAEAENIPAIRSIAVLGAGTMGAGIAQLAATRGFGVTIKDVDDSVLTQGMQRIEKITRKGVEKGVLSSPEAESAVASIKTTTGTIPNASADLVIEAIVEQLEVKQEAFRELDAQMPATILFTSNTSALPISEMATVTKRPDRFAGLHFFNPVHKMPLVEIIRCTETSDATVTSLINLVRKLGKTPLVVAEGPGFLVNRILFPYLDEAVRLVCEGWPVDQVDNEAKHFGWPMGPLELLDHVGIDVSADVAETLSIRCTDASPTPRKLAELVAAGHKGQKNGQGFYKYKDGRRGRLATRPHNTTSNTLPSPREFAGEELSGIQQRLVFSTLNAAADCLSEGIVREPWIVDLGMVLGTGFAPFRGGPMSLIETWGRERVVETLADLSDLCGPRFKPSAYFDSGVEPTRNGTAKTLSTPHA